MLIVLVRIPEGANDVLHGLSASTVKALCMFMSSTYRRRRRRHIDQHGHHRPFVIMISINIFIVFIFIIIIIIIIIISTPFMTNNKQTNKNTNTLRISVLLTQSLIFQLYNQNTEREKIKYRNQ